MDDDFNLWTAAVFGTKGDFAQEELVSVDWWYERGALYRLLKQSKEAAKRTRPGTVYNEWRIVADLPN